MALVHKELELQRARKVVSTIAFAHLLVGKRNTKGLAEEQQEKSLVRSKTKMKKGVRREPKKNHVHVLSLSVDVSTVQSNELQNSNFTILGSAIWVSGFCTRELKKHKKKETKKKILRGFLVRARKSHEKEAAQRKAMQKEYAIAFEFSL